LGHDDLKTKRWQRSKENEHPLPSIERSHSFVLGGNYIHRTVGLGSDPLCELHEEHKAVDDHDNKRHRYPQHLDHWVVVAGHSLRFDNYDDNDDAAHALLLSRMLIRMKMMMMMMYRSPTQRNRTADFVPLSTCKRTDLYSDLPFELDDTPTACDGLDIEEAAPTAKKTTKKKKHSYGPLLP
jgi:hypothetical protein